MGSSVKQCMYCMDGKVGILKPRPLDAVVHGKEVGDFDLLHIGTGGQ